MATKRTVSLRTLLVPGALLLGAGLLPPRSAAAQDQRITLRSFPVANLTVKVGMTQEMNFDMDMQGMGMGPMKLEGFTKFSATQQVGAPDAQGRTAAKMVWDDISVDMKMNGNSMAPGVASPLIGKTITIVYDAQGKVTDVQIPAELGEAGNLVKQMVTGLSGSIPNVALGIGDTVAVPISIPLPIPMGSGQAPNMEARTVSKLAAIERSGGDRIAVLDQLVQATLKQPLQMPGPNGSTMSVDMDLKMSGTGKLRLNVDKGFVQSSNTDMKIDMTMVMQGMTIKLNGTMRQVMTGAQQP